MSARPRAAVRLVGRLVVERRIGPLAAVDVEAEVVEFGVNEADAIPVDAPDRRGSTVWVSVPGTVRIAVRAVEFFGYQKTVAGLPWPW